MSEILIPPDAGSPAGSLPEVAAGALPAARRQQPWPRLLATPSLPLPVRDPGRRTEPIASGSEWTMSTLEKFDVAIARHARDHGLETNPVQYELITASQMIDLCSTVGMPVHYPHWSFGKQLLSQEHDYRRGQTGLAYEIVINTNPAIAYLMETNSMALQVLVMAHAGYGHNAFFRNNYLFRQFTQADAILDYLQFARGYLHQCEQQHGWRAVESLLDCCHALAPWGVDRYSRPAHLSLRRERERVRDRIAFAERHYNPDYAHLHMQDAAAAAAAEDQESEPDEPFEVQENLLYFLEKRAPRLAPWQREVVRIVRKVSQYFYPQRLTKVANEGAATFWHYTLLHGLYDAGEVDDGFMIEWLADHAGVVAQPAFDSKNYQGINPYALGFSIFRDIRRICEQPAPEDREWFPRLAGTDWREAVAFAMANFQDESLIEQYLSPRVMRAMRLFQLHDDEGDAAHYHVRAIHNEAGYVRLRQSLAAQYRPARHTPQIVVARADDNASRALLLHHMVDGGRLLEEDTIAPMLACVKELWKFDVVLEEIDAEGRRLRIHRT
jgi:stage V sporulation protein R